MERSELERGDAKSAQAGMYRGIDDDNARKRQ
jgi:hypothetical protein